MTDLPEIQKLTVYVPVSAEQLAAADDLRSALDEAARRTPEQWAAIAAKRKAEVARKLAAAQAEHAAARATVGGKLAEVLDLHRPCLSEYALWVECGGCEYGGHDAEPPEWPCTTWALIAGEDE